MPSQTTPKAPKKKKKSKSFILSLALIAVMGYFIISVISLQIDINSKQNEVESAKALNEQAALKNDELNEMLKEDDSTYIERIARDILGYVLPGERVYYDISSGE